ncbi:MAG: glycosyltransferase involved in cell wall biosynthesis [Desulforhopalus sp.]|jgi:glycosyltransferase involved in cell wall biosynthesis
MYIYIDCTDLIQTDLNTGIQRVARNIINNRLLAEQKHGIIYQPVCYYKKYGFIKVQGCQKNDLRNSVGYLHNIRFYLNEYWRFKRLSKSIFPFSEFDNWIEHHWQIKKNWLLPLLLVLFVSPLALVAFVYTELIPPRNPWKPKKDDILIIPGSSWVDSNSDILSGIYAVKTVFGRVATIFYDLIPISHPQYVFESTVKEFTSNFPLIVASTDIFIAISMTTENILKEYLQKNTVADKPSTSHFLLGADLDPIKHTSEVRKTLQSHFKKNKPYLCVGTIEPRKNHTLLMDVFDKIWDSDQDIHLCIIGRYGWKSEKLEERIKTHPLFGKKLTWFTDLNDAELSYCYKNAKALIFPSIIEGFGLPLIEALHYGCPVMASDIPVFREIGGNRCSYFTIDTPDSLIAEINYFEKCGKPSCEQPTDEFEWVSWEESALEFYRIVTEHFNTNENSTAN